MRPIYQITYLTKQTKAIEAENINQAAQIAQLLRQNDPSMVMLSIVKFDLDAKVIPPEPPSAA